MNKWIKNKFRQLSDKLNQEQGEEKNMEREEVRPKAVQNKTSEITSPQNTLFDNIESFKEVIIGAITNTARMLGYGNTTISGLTFHTKFADNAIENVSLQSLIKDDDFIKQLKRTFKSKGIRYKEDFPVDVLHESGLVDKVTRITDGIGVEVLTPKEMLRKIRAKVVATEGITWEPEYILEPTGKNYFIGRCKDPKIDNGPKIHNDIAFIGIEEINEDQYKINSYISRSHANIIFDKDAGAYKIYRSRFLNNPSHKIKIYNTSLNDFSGVSLNTATVPHLLKNGDSICFNDKIILDFTIIE